MFEAGFVFLWLLFFFNDTATTEIYALSLHAALPICRGPRGARLHRRRPRRPPARAFGGGSRRDSGSHRRSAEPTSELQAQSNLVCRLLLANKKNSTTHSARSFLSETATEMYRLRRTS